MAVHYEDSFSEEDDEPIAYLLLVILSVLLVWVFAPKLLQMISHVINQRRHLKATWSKKVALIVASNQREAYKAELYCSVCYAPPTRRCSKCRAVAYCCEQCQGDHWRQGHREECRLMEDVEETTKLADDDGFLGLQDRNEDMAEVCCKSDLWFWSEYDIFNVQGYEKDGRVRYLEDEYQRQTDNAEVSGGNEASESKPGIFSEFDNQGTWVTAWLGEDLPFIALTCNEDLVTPISNSYSLSKVCCKKCQVVLVCPEHSQGHEWINGEKQEPQLVDCVEESSSTTPEESEFEDYIPHIAPTLDAIAASGWSPMRVTTSGDEAIGNRYPNFERSSTSSSSDSFSGSSSMDSSVVSDAISSLHGLD